MTAAIERATGYRPHPSTVCRWHRKGVGGVRLKTAMVGGRPMSTVDWVLDFIDARTTAAGLSGETEISVDA